jgi:hypothetical protein
MGCILGCRTAALGIAAGLSIGRSPFLRIDVPRSEGSADQSTGFDKTEQILTARHDLAEKVGNSDHALSAALYNEWTSRRGQNKRRSELCESLGLSVPAMKELEQLGSLLDTALRNLGFQPSNESDRHANSNRIIHTCAISAMSPSQLVKVVRPKTTYDKTAQGAKEKDNHSRDLKLFIRLPCDDKESTEHDSNTDKAAYTKKAYREERVFIHPASSNFAIGSYSCPWLVYFQLLRTTKPYLRDVTECSPYALLLFGGALTVQASKDVIIIDDWATLSANARIGSLVGGLRRQVDLLLANKASDASIDISSTDTMKLIATLLQTDG